MIYPKLTCDRSGQTRFACAWGPMEKVTSPSGDATVSIPGFGTGFQIFGDFVNDLCLFSFVNIYRRQWPNQFVLLHNPIMIFIGLTDVSGIQSSSSNLV